MSADTISNDALKEEVIEIQEYLRTNGEYRKANMLDFINYGNDKNERFASELTHFINCHSLENESNTPDFILAHFLKKCLEAYEYAIKTRDKWYEFKPFQGKNIVREKTECDT